MADSRLLTENQAAIYLGIPRTAIKNILVGRVPIAGRIRWDRVALDAWLDELRGVKADVPANSNKTDAEQALERFLASAGHAPRRP